MPRDPLSFNSSLVHGYVGCYRLIAKIRKLGGGKSVEAHPELFFDGRYWDVEYATLDYGRATATEAAQAQILRYYASLLTDAVWLAEQDPTDLAEASRARLLRAALALELLTANVARESDS